MIAKGLNKLSNQAKGTLGETVTKIKFGAMGYVSNGIAEVEIGGTTATGRVQVVKYDHAMANVFTGNEITVESKFNTSGLTSNQATAGNLEKSRTGKGAVPPSARAKQRVPSAKEKAKEREDNDNKCANCGNETAAEDTRSHHYPDRHADGGNKTVPVCKDCHTYLRSN